MRHLSRMLFLFLVLLLAAGAGSQSQTEPQAESAQPAAQAAAAPDPQFPRPRSSEDRFRIEHEREMARKRNQERQAAIKKDTDKLLQLATELKQYVDKSSENVLSLDVIKKAEEIEKLSKSVKDKMKAEEYYPAVGSEEPK